MKVTIAQLLLFVAAFTTLVHTAPAEQVYERDLENVDGRDLSLDYELEARDLPNFERETRDYNDHDLEARDSLVHALDARKGAGGVGDVVEFVVDLVSGIKAQIAADKLARSGFTQQVVAQGRQQKPLYNWVICHTKHETHFDGVQGKDWEHSHQEFDIKLGGTIGYEIYWFSSGTFKRIGDGGYLNWAFAGVIKSQSADGKQITFGKPT